MKISIKEPKIRAEIVLSDDAHIGDCMDAIVAALFMEGYSLKAIKMALENKSECIENVIDNLLENE